MTRFARLLALAILLPILSLGNASPVARAASPTPEDGPSDQRRNIERNYAYDQTAERSNCIANSGLGTSTVPGPGNYAPDTKCGGTAYPVVNDEAGLATSIDDYIRSVSPRSPFIGLGRDFVEAGKQWGVNPLWIVTIARKETVLGVTGSGISQGSFDAFGRRAASGQPSAGGWYKYAGWKESLYGQAQFLRENYINKGFDTIQKAMFRYAPPSENDTTTYINQLHQWISDMVTRAGASLGCSNVTDATSGPAATGSVTPTPAAPTPAPISVANASTQSCQQTSLPLTNTPTGNVALVTGTRQDLVDRLLANPLFKADGPNVRSDIVNGIVTDRLVALLVTIVEQAKLPIRVTTLKSDHQKCSAGGGVSNHYSGNAADVGNVDGVDSANGVALHQFLYRNRQTLQLDELILSPAPAGDQNLKSGQDFTYDSGTLADHTNHLHVSVSGPASTSTASSGTSKCK